MTRLRRLVTLGVIVVVLAVAAGGMTAAADAAADDPEFTTDASDDDLIESADRTVATTATPGETVTVTVTVDLTESVSDLRITEEFDPAANVSVVDNDGATVTSVTDTGDTLFGSWGGTDTVTLTYEITIDEDAQVGDEITVTGEVEAEQEHVVDLEAATISVSAIDDVKRDLRGGAKAGDTVPVELTLSLSQSATDLTVSESISPAVDDVTVSDDDGATVSAATDADTELVASWGDRRNVTLAYTVTIPADATQGDRFNIFGTATIDGVTVALPDDRIIVSARPEAVDYADEETGSVGAKGLGSAAADFRSGSIDPADIGSIAAAFRAGEIVL